MKIIGITGNSGSGKTTLSAIFARKEKIKLIDADNVVKELSIPGTEYLNSIKETFGNDVFFEDGYLNRKKLANKIYTNTTACELLNKLTFKFVVNEIILRLEKLKNENLEYIVLDAPLLFESNLNNYCDFVISLISDINLKIKRICQRDNIDEETARKRLKIQQTNEYYIEKSDFVIENSEACNLEKEVENILKKIEENFCE